MAQQLRVDHGLAVNDWDRPGAAQHFFHRSVEVRDVRAGDVADGRVPTLGPGGCECGLKGGAQFSLCVGVLG